MSSNKPIKKRPGARKSAYSSPQQKTTSFKSINKKYLAGIPVFLILIFLLYAANAGQFAMGYGSMLQNYETNADYYFGYDLSWKGPIKPIIKDIKLTRFGISEYNKEGDPAFVKPFIDEKGHTGLLDSNDYAEHIENGRISYKDVQDYKMKDRSTTLVLRMNVQQEEEYRDDFKEVVVYYTVLGIKKKQVFPFDGFLLVTGDCCDIPH